MLNQAPDRIEALKAEPFLTPEATMPVLVAELANTLAAERRARQELGSPWENSTTASTPWRRARV